MNTLSLLVERCPKEPQAKWNLHGSHQRTLKANWTASLVDNT